MSCETIREHFVDYLYGEPSEEVIARVQHEVSECADCAAELEKLETVKSAMSSLPALEVPPRVHQDILREARLAADRRAPGSGRGFSLALIWRSPAFAAACLVALVLGVGLLLRSPQTSPEGTEGAVPPQVAETPPSEPTGGEPATVVASLDEGEQVDESPEMRARGTSGVSSAPGQGGLDRRSELDRLALRVPPQPAPPRPAAASETEPVEERQESALGDAVAAESAGHRGSDFDADLEGWPQNELPATTRAEGESTGAPGGSEVAAVSGEVGQGEAQTTPAVDLPLLEDAVANDSLSATGATTEAEGTLAARRSREDDETHRHQRDTSATASDARAQEPAPAQAGAEASREAVAALETRTDGEPPAADTAAGPARVQLAVEQYRAGDFGNARDNLEWVVGNTRAGTSENLLAHFHLGNALLAMGDYGAAADNFRVVVAEPAFPQRPAALFGLAQAYERSGDLLDAEDIYGDLAGWPNPYQEPSGEALERVRGEQRRRAAEPQDRPAFDSNSSAY